MNIKLYNCNFRRYVQYTHGATNVWKEDKKKKHNFLNWFVPINNKKIRRKQNILSN